uniref:Uncharacterized protein n=1 Tax=Anguilla anguilla TaxID=7936 RepID=A0A0E9PKP6_ANGAN
MRNCSCNRDRLPPAAAAAGNYSLLTAENADHGSTRSLLFGGFELQ